MTMAKEVAYAIIMAAGRGRRFASSLPKPLHPIAGLPMLGHVIAGLEPLAGRLAVVIPPKEEELAELVRPHQAVIQEDPKGTGHAALKGLEGLESVEAAGQAVLLTNADSPLIKAKSFRALFGARAEGAKLSVLGFRPSDPTGYGRLVTNERGRVTGIIEEKDTTARERGIGLCYAGAMVASAGDLLSWLRQCDCNNASGEYYLTDIIGFASAEGTEIAVVEASEEEVAGANRRADLAKLEAIWQQERRVRAMEEEGVTLRDPATVWFSHDTKLARDVVIDPQVYFGIGVMVGEGAHIKSFSHIEGAEIGRFAQIGPFARIRPGSVLGEATRIGNFVEVKKSRLEKNVKAGHLAYIGDAIIGEGVNVGAGVVTCNYDGVGKYETRVEKNVFIGSNASLVAPLTIGEGAVIGAGTVVTENVEADAIALSRPLLEQKKKAASKRRARLKKQQEKQE